MSTSIISQPPPLMRRARRWVDRVRDRFAARRFDYPGSLEAHVAARQPRLQTHATPGQFSFLTGVYEKTPAPLFRQTAASVFAQTTSEFEWVVLAHGAIPDPLRGALNDVAADPRVLLIELEENRGIIGGMRVCLEAATGRYVIPLDADDLLFPDALQVFAQAIADHDAPAFLYSDEDHYADGRPFAPFQRPDWDPVLNLAGSYIWHLCAFDRRAALELGVYSDLGSNYCHDWDTVCRFARGGHTPLHVPEIIYHWRTHAASHTNRRQPHPGSVQSQRHVLETHIAAQRRPELYDVRPFPMDRGSRECAITRKPRSPPPFAWISYGDAQSLANCEIDFPFQSRRHVPANTMPIIEAARDAQAEFVAIAADNLEPVDQNWIWEAVGLWELHADVALIAGRIVNRRGIVLGGGEFRAADGSYVCPAAGRDATSPGPFSLWLKPRTVDAVDPRFFLVRASFLADIAGESPPGALADLGRWLGAAARSRGHRVATSPLISAKGAAR